MRRRRRRRPRFRPALLPPKPKPGAATRAKASNRGPVEARLAELKQRLREISDLEAADAVLSWDHATFMPAGGAPARARQGALLSRLAHERSVDPALGRLLD